MSTSPALARDTAFKVGVRVLARDQGVAPGGTRTGLVTDEAPPGASAGEAGEWSAARSDDAGGPAGPVRGGGGWAQGPGGRSGAGQGRGKGGGGLIESAAEQQRRLEESREAWGEKTTAQHAATSLVEEARWALWEVEKSGLTGEALKHALQQAGWKLAAAEKEERVASAERTEAAERALATEAEAKRQTQLVLDQNPSDGEKRIAEARARMDSPGATHRAQRDSVLRNRLAGAEVRRAQSRYGAYVAKNASTAGSKHMALGAVAAQAESDRNSRRQANSAQQKVQDALAGRAGATKNGPAHDEEGNPLHPLKPAERRELAQLRADEPKRRQEDARLARSARSAEDRRDRHALLHGKAILSNLEKTADRCADKLFKVLLKLSGLAPRDPGQEQLAAKYHRLLGAMEAANQAVDRLEHFLRTGKWPREAGPEPAPGDLVPAEPVPPGCPPDYETRCCDCPPWTTCVCPGAAGGGGGGGAGAVGPAHDPGAHGDYAVPSAPPPIRDSNPGAGRAAARICPDGVLCAGVADGPALNQPDRCAEAKDLLAKIEAARGAGEDLARAIEQSQKHWQPTRKDPLRDDGDIELPNATSRDSGDFDKACVAAARATFGSLRGLWGKYTKVAEAAKRAARGEGFGYTARDATEAVASWMLAGCPEGDLEARARDSVARLTSQLAMAATSVELGQAAVSAGFGVAGHKGLFRAHRLGFDCQRVLNFMDLALRLQGEHSLEMLRLLSRRQLDDFVELLLDAEQELHEGYEGLELFEPEFVYQEPSEPPSFLEFVGNFLEATLLVLGALAGMGGGGARQRPARFNRKSTSGAGAGGRRRQRPTQLGAESRPKPTGKRPGGEGGRPLTDREKTLGTDIDSGQFRPGEAQAARRLEERVGPLKRDPSKAGDWVDGAGRVYDGVGPVPPEHFRMDQFGAQIERHLLKQGVDRVVVDTAGLAAKDAAAVRAFVDGLSPASRARVIIQGQ